MPDHVPGPVCPECGLTAAAARVEIAHQSWIVRRLPWLVVVLLVALQGAPSLAPGPMRGWLVLTVPPTTAPQFAGAEHGYTRADLESLAAAAAPGDRLLRDLLREGQPHAFTQAADTVEFCFDRPRGRQLRVTTQGWPAHWRNLNTSRDTENVFEDEHPLAAEPRDAGPWRVVSSPWSWRLRVMTRSKDDWSQQEYLVTSMRLALAVLGVALAYGIARLAGRVLRARSRGRRVFAWAIGTGIAAFLLAGFVTLAARAGDDRLWLIPEDAATRPWVPLGGTVGDLRAMLGREDADAQLAAMVLAKAPKQTTAGSVLLARRVLATREQIALLDLGWPERLVTYQRVWTPPLAPPADPAPQEATLGSLTAQLGAVSWELPRVGGAGSSVSLRLEVGELAAWTLFLAIVFAAVRALVGLGLARRRRRRLRAGRCAGCGYDLRGAAAAPAGP